MEIEVKNCNECQFNEMAGWEGEIRACAITHKTIPATKPMFGEIKELPKWCPLRKEPITIKLKA